MEQARGGHRMIPDANLDPKVAALVSAAFDKSWPFVKTDPELAHVDRQERRTRLAQNLTRIAQDGERDMWRLANAAIGQLRGERHAAERRHPKTSLGRIPLVAAGGILFVRDDPKPIRGSAPHAGASCPPGATAGSRVRIAG